LTRELIITAVGSLAGLLTVASFIPQTVRALRSRRTQDLSAVTFVLLVLQAALWTAYGVLLGQAPIIWTNSFVLVFTVTILLAKLRHG